MTNEINEDEKPMSHKLTTHLDNSKENEDLEKMRSDPNFVKFAEFISEMSTGGSE